MFNSPFIRNIADDQNGVNGQESSNRGELLLAHRYEGIDLDLAWAQPTMEALHRVGYQWRFAGARMKVSQRGLDSSVVSVWMKQWRWTQTGC